MSSNAAPDLSDDRFKIPKLKGSADFYTWSFAVKELMIRDSVDYVLTEARPDAPVSARNKWDKDNRKARSHIVLNLAEAALITVAGLLSTGGTSKDVWEKLEKTYLKDNLQAKLNIRSKIHSMKFETNKNFDEHYNTFSKYCLDLARLGDPVDPKDQMMLLLNSMLQEFRNLNSIAGVSNLDVDGIVGLIRSEL